MTTSVRASRSLLALALVTGLSLAACGAATAPPASISPEPTPSAPPANVTEPGGGGSAGQPGSGGSTDPNSGVGIDLPLNPTPIDPGAGQPTLVVPRPGQIDPHPVAPTSLLASVDGRHVLVKVTWYGGVEPCSILDSVKVERSGTDIAITPFEGRGPGDVMCIELAVEKATIVDLGELEPGTYRITAPNSDAPPIEVSVS